MEIGVMVVLPRGKAGENFAILMAKEMENLGGRNRLGFVYPYLPEYHEGNPALLQSVSAIVRDGLVSGVSEFLFVDTGVIPVLTDIEPMLPEGADPLIYNPVLEAKSYFADPHDRPLWLDRWSNMKKIDGFETLYSRDVQKLERLVEEVYWRTRGVTGGIMENVPDGLKANVLDEEFLRTRAAELLVELCSLEAKNGILLGNVELATALTRFVDEEFREVLDNCNLVSLAKVLATRLA